MNKLIFIITIIRKMYYSMITITVEGYVAIFAFSLMAYFARGFTFGLGAFLILFISIVIFGIGLRNNEE